jgi:hypothetical protein
LRETKSQDTQHLSWETLMGEKTQPNFLNIDSQYNAKKINQNNREYPTLSNAPLSSFFSQVQLSKLAHLMSEWVSEQMRRYPPLFIPAGRRWKGVTSLDMAYFSS